MSKKEDTLLDMDFGDLISLDDNSVPMDDMITTEEESKNKKDDTKSKEETELDVSEIIDSQNEDEDTTEGDNDDTTGDDNTVESSKEDNDDKRPPASDDTDDKQKEPFTLVFAKHLKEQGILSSDLDDEELTKIIESEGEDKALENLMMSEIEKAKESLSGELEGYAKEYANLREMGYSAEEAGAFISNMEDVDSIKEDQLESDDAEDLRREILTQHYKATTKFSDDRIKKLVKRSFDLGDDIEDSKEALNALKDFNKEQLEEVKKQEEEQKKQAQENYKKYVESLDKTINDTKEIIPGVNINKQTKDKIKEMITKPVQKDNQGRVLNGIWSKRSEDPIKFDTVLAYMIQTGAFDGKWDKITKVSTTKATSKLQDAIDSQNSKAGFNSRGRTPKYNKDDKDNLGPLRSLLK